MREGMNGKGNEVAVCDKRLNVISGSHYSNLTVFKIFDIPGDNKINLPVQFFINIYLQDFFPVLSCNRNFSVH
jgi:hypothetical protein